MARATVASPRHAASPLGAVPLLLITALAAACGSVETGPPADSQRIVVMAPAAGEMLDQLGMLDHVVGIGDFVREPQPIAGLPKVGAYDRPDVERLLSLGTRLYVTADSRAADDAHRRLEALGVRVVALDTSTFEGVFASLARLGDVLGREDLATELASELRAELEAVRERARNAPERRVLFVVGREPLYVAGPGSHIDEMIRLVGGTNVAADTRSSYTRLSMEAALERLPEVIVDTSDNGADARRGRAEGDWGRWGFLPAVRDDRVYWVDPVKLVIPGMRLPEMTWRMGRLVHPEIFGQPTESDWGRAVSVE